MPWDEEPEPDDPICPQCDEFVALGLCERKCDDQCDCRCHRLDVEQSRHTQYLEDLL
jgi:hypothetical protein